MSTRFSFFVVTASLLLSSAPGCGSTDPTGGPSLPSFQDPSSAPGPIQAAAKAVVRIETAGELATGSFISGDGLLLTNNHVLGITICPLEGCYVELSFDYERGATPSQPTTVFAVPQAVDTGLDIALVQTYSAKGGSPLVTPSYLVIDPRTPSQLLGTHVTVVGHPEGHLKKWTAGEVVDSDGAWVWADLYGLPGNSGSPILEDDGKMVGILHRGPTSQDLFTSSGVDEYMIGTASAPLLAAMKLPLTSEVMSVAASTTAANVVANDLVYQNAHVPTANVAATAGGAATPTDVLSLLASACDAALASTDFASPDDLTTLLTPCDDALSWIECRTDAPAFGPSNGTECPAGTDLLAWGKRFQSEFEKWRAYNGETLLTYVSFAQAQLQTSMLAGTAEGGQDLLSGLEEAGAPLDLAVANYLAAFGAAQYGGVPLGGYVTDYAKVPDYGLNGTSIASAAVWMLDNGQMTRSGALAVLAALASDDTVDIAAKLYIEEVQWEAGAIE